MLVAAGKNDPRVPVIQADTMVAAIKANGTPLWYLRAGNEGHSMRLNDNVSYQLLVSLLHNLESDLKTHVSVDHVVRKC
jgi:dipeptidyl aminopeptidase/acylaminoacyl peptidase